MRQFIDSTQRILFSVVLGLATSAVAIAAGGGGSGGSSGPGGGGSAGASSVNAGGGGHASSGGAGGFSGGGEASHGGGGGGGVRSAGLVPAPVAPNGTPTPSPSAAPVTPNSNTNIAGGGRDGGGRASWRHRGDNGGYFYGGGLLPYGYGNDNITAGSDGYYNNYYGYGPGYPYGNWNNGVTTGGNNAGGTTDVPTSPAPANAPALSAPAEPSAVATAAQIQNSVENSPELIAADGAVQRDQQAYDAERRRVIDGLQNDPKYQGAMNRRKQAQLQVADIKSHDAVPDPAAVAPVAQAKLDAADEITRLREDAIDNDPAAKAAKTKLDDDVQRRDEVRQQLLAKYQPAASR